MAAPANNNLRRSFSFINTICATSSLSKFRVSGFDRLILTPSAEQSETAPRTLTTEERSALPRFAGVL
jgi:hypothetical protein